MLVASLQGFLPNAFGIPAAHLGLLEPGAGFTRRARVGS